MQNIGDTIRQTYVLQPVMKSDETRDSLMLLRDSIAESTFIQLGENMNVESFFNKNQVATENIAKLRAKLAFDFAEAFMRERYERGCLLRATFKVDLSKAEEGKD